ncbi:hypothetical protein MUDAN_IGPPGNFN_03607 [Lactiplantibacillus mudanjiangensis]|nr:hypothetical protein MUDAN_IGPPGNFN_03607 [Lactiplantibacillus mudanjiangensis]
MGLAHNTQKSALMHWGFDGSQVNVRRRILVQPNYVIQPLQGLSLIHISEPTRRRGISYAVFCLKKKKNKKKKQKKKKK